MVFRNLIAKPRKEKAKKDGEPPLIQPTQIGNDIVNIEAMRYQLRTQVCVIFQYFHVSSHPNRSFVIIEYFSVAIFSLIEML